MSFGSRQVWILVALCTFMFSATNGQAQTCGNDYQIKEGDSLSQIARRAYGNGSQWTMIYYANQDRLGTNATFITPGIKIRIPCIGGEERKSLPRDAVTQATSKTKNSFVLSRLVQRIEFLTADGYEPFTGRALPNGGLVTDLLGRSMALIKKQSGGRFDYKVSWVNDWAAHLDPLLVNRAFDAGFPWSNPKCDQFETLDKETQFRCRNFFYSDPVFELFTVLVTKKDSDLVFDNDDDILGKTLCQPYGYSTTALDKDGRNWLKDGKIVLMRPQTPEDCFHLLEQGVIDAVVTSDLTGRAILSGLGMTDRVKIIDRPVSIGTLSVIIPKTHPQARTLLYYVNSGLKKLRDDGEFDKIVSTHLTRFWDSVQGTQMSAGQPSDSNKTSPTAAPATSVDTTTSPDPQNTDPSKSEDSDSKNKVGSTDTAQSKKDN